jgi:hypothetical protein
MENVSRRKALQMGSIVALGSVSPIMKEPNNIKSIFSLEPEQVKPTASIKYFLTRNLLIPSVNENGDQLYDLNVFGRYWAVVGTITWISPKISDIKYIRFESSPFMLEHSTDLDVDNFLKRIGEKVDLFTNKATCINNMSSVISLPFKEIIA